MYFNKNEQKILSSLFEPTIFKIGVIGLTKDERIKSVMKEIVEELNGNFTKIKDEISSSGTFFYLEDYLKMENDLDDQKAKLTEINAGNKLILRNLKKKLAKQNTVDKIELIKIKGFIGETEEQLHDKHITSAIKNRVAKKWEHSRIEQLKHQQIRKSDRIKEKVEAFQEKQKFENFVQKELSDYDDKYFEWVEENLNYWMDKYDKETETLDSELQSEREDKKQLDAKIEFHKKTYSDREKDIDNYIAFKKKKADEEKYKILCNSKAVKIQAWWRGAIVRKNLGPYKKSKPKKKDKKSAKTK